MTFYANLGYNFALPNKSGIELIPSGSIILASSMPMHQLERRKDLELRYPHMRKRLFDPQLYLAGLDANQSAPACAKLASYPWFGINNLRKYSSGQQKQLQWKKEAEQTIPSLWLGTPPSEEKSVRAIVGECVDFQKRLNCQALILPSPLTTDPNTSYSQELLWLDAGLDYKRAHGIDLPAFATVALSDLCLYYTEPSQNHFLDMILDTVTARGVDGVYLVLEQSREQAETWHISNTRALWSLLHLTHIFTQEAKLRVAVNFLGQFGLACEAAGAEIWASDFYKSTYRLRLADKIGGGRSFPSYWSFSAATSINLKTDFDRLGRAGVINQIADRTEASNGLLMATSSGHGSNSIPAWEYRQSNVAAAREHFLRSSLQAAQTLAGYQGQEKLDFISGWLEEAMKNVQAIDGVLGKSAATSTMHVRAWFDAFNNYRVDHKE